LKPSSVSQSSPDPFPSACDAVSRDTAVEKYLKNEASSIVKRETEPGQRSKKSFKLLKNRSITKRILRPIWYRD
jgi:hypothetical protein